MKAIENVEDLSKQLERYLVDKQGKANVLDVLSFKEAIESELEVVGDAWGKRMRLVVKGEQELQGQVEVDRRSDGTTGISSKGKEKTGDWGKGNAWPDIDVV